VSFGIFSTLYDLEIYLLNLRNIRGGGEGGFKAKISHVPDMFPEEFPIALQFYPICFVKCCTPRQGIPYFEIEPFILESIHSFFFFFLSDGQIKLARCQKRKIEYEMLLI
jgi:hypothetical protein